jgi:hypothetical protein
MMPFPTILCACILQTADASLHQAETVPVHAASQKWPVVHAPDLIPSASFLRALSEWQSVGQSSSRVQVCLIDNAPTTAGGALGDSLLAPGAEVGIALVNSSLATESVSGSIAIGPLAIPVAVRLQQRWWELEAKGIAWSAVAEATPCTALTSINLALPSDEKRASLHKVVQIDRSDRTAAELHWAAAHALISLSTSSASLEMPTAGALALPEIPNISANVFEFIAWFEAADARQAALRMTGKRKEADETIVDIAAFATAIHFDALPLLLNDRVPKGIEGFRSLTMHPSWPQEVWPLVACVESMQTTLTLAREGFATMTAELCTARKLPPSARADLQARLATVAENLPPGFVWSKLFEAEVRNHLFEACSLGAHFGGIARFPAFESSSIEDLAFIMPTIAWEVFGHAWAQPGALLPSQIVRRDAQIASYDRLIREAVAAGKAVREREDLSEFTLAATQASLHHAQRDWMPWFVFDASAQGFAAGQAELKQEIADWPYALGTGTTASSVGYELIDSAMQSRSRPWLFNDCWASFWDGYIVVHPRR